MFYDPEQPLEFSVQVADSLADGTIYNEHLEYYYVSHNAVNADSFAFKLSRQHAPFALDEANVAALP